LFLSFLIIKNKFIKEKILFKEIETSHISKTFICHSIILVILLLRNIYLSKIEL